MTDEQPRRSRWPRRIAFTLVVVVVVLLIADRVGAYVAERKAGSTIESSQHLASRPDVDIAGFPFLTQLAAGSFGKITVTAKNVTINPRGIPLPISKLRVVLHHLTVSRSLSSFHADSADATALIAYGDLGTALGVDLGYAGSGRVKATKSVTVAGKTIGATVTATPQLVNGALSFGATTINGLGSLSAAVISTLRGVFNLDLPLNGIPFGVRVQKLDADSTGVHIVLGGQNLSYTN